MRYKVAHLLLFVLASGIAFAIHRSLWGPQHHNAKIVFGAYLACLVTASIATFYATPRWRRLWLGYAAFGWCWLALVLWDYLGRIPDMYTPNMMAYSLLGMALLYAVAMGLAGGLLPAIRAARLPIVTALRQL